MARYFKSRTQGLGRKPGELVFIGSHDKEEIRTSLIDYSEKGIREDVWSDLPADKDLENPSTSLWLNFDGLHDLNRMDRIEERFELHPLVMADIVNTALRPKIEEIEGGIFFVLKMLRYSESDKKVMSEQFSMILRDDILLTFQEYPGDVFDPIRERLRAGKGRIRTAGLDYLAYCMMDSIIDNYISIVERIGEQIENNEEALLVNATPEVMERIIMLKREIIYLRKTIRPVIEAVQFLTKCENPLIRESTEPFINDLFANIRQVSEAIDTYREMLSEQLDTYNSLIGNRLNDIMKILTIFSVIFIPLTFIAGIYGTNFDYIPELHFRYGYLMLWGIILALAGAMLFVFKRKKWL